MTVVTCPRCRQQGGVLNERHEQCMAALNNNLRDCPGMALHVMPIQASMACPECVRELRRERGGSASQSQSQSTGARRR